MSNSSGEILRGQQLHLMSECGNVTRPVMRAAAGLHDHAGRC